MSYIEQSLGPHERVVARAELAWIYRLFAWLALAAGLALAAVLVIGRQAGAISAPGAVILGAAGLAVFLWAMIPVWTTEIAVTNQRLVVKKGLFTRTSEELQLWSIEEVDWEQGVLDRLLGFGRLVICGTGEEDMRLPLISDALAFRKSVQAAISESRPGQQPAAKP